MIFKITYKNGSVGYRIPAEGQNATVLGDLQYDARVASFIEITQEQYDRDMIIRQIERDLREVDIATMRPIRAITIGEGKEYDHQKLRELEERAKALREELKNYVQ